MEKLFAINTVVSGITGERQIASLKALGVDLSSLPKDLRAVWKEGVVPLEKLRPTGTFRRQVAEHLFKHAARGQFGWVVTEDNAKSVIAWLKTKQAEHQRYVDGLVANWPVICNEAQEAMLAKFGQHPMASKLLGAMKRAQPDESEIRRKLRLTYSVKEYYEVGGSDDPELDAELRRSAEEEQTGLVHQLFKDTVQTAEELYDLFTSGDQNGRTINRRSLRKVEDYLVKKINALSFLDQRLKALAGGVQRVLDPLLQVPAGKTITSGQCGDLIAMLTVLSSERRLKARLDALQPGEVLTVASMLPTLQVEEDADDDTAESATETETAEASAEAVTEEADTTPDLFSEEPVTQAAPVAARPSLARMVWG